MQEEFIAQLRQFVVFPVDDGATAGSAPAPSVRTQQARTPAGGSASLSLALRSPMLPPLSPPRADAEVAALEAEVTAAAQRVAELRTSMQARLQAQLAAKLAACRPSAELDADETPGGNGATDMVAEQQQLQENGDSRLQAQAQSQAGTEQARAGDAEAELQVQPMEAGGTAAQSPAAAVAAGASEMVGAPAPAAGEQQQQSEAPAPVPLSPQPAELQQRLMAAASRMPALRARLEAATDRLQRVVAAVAADINRAPPNTVEKAVLGKTPGKPSAAAPGEPAEGAENQEPRVSPLVQQVGWLGRALFAGLRLGGSMAPGRHANRAAGTRDHTDHDRGNRIGCISWLCHACMHPLVGLMLFSLMSGICVMLLHFAGAGVWPDQHAPAHWP